MYLDYLLLINAVRKATKTPPDAESLSLESRSTQCEDTSLMTVTG